MIKIDQLNIIHEENTFWLFFQAEDKACRFSISNYLVQRIYYILQKENHILNKIMTSMFVSYKRCVIRENGEKAMLEIDNQIYHGDLDELLPLALELKADIFIEDACFQSDYVYDPVHEKDIENMREQAEYYYRENLIQDLIKNIETAIKAEKYEQAAILRDQIISLEKQNEDDKNLSDIK